MDAMDDGPGNLSPCPPQNAVDKIRTEPGTPSSLRVDGMDRMDETDKVFTCPPSISSISSMSSTIPPAL
jgi:hypothetical protein